VLESECSFILPASCLITAQEAAIPRSRISIAHHGKSIFLFGDTHQRAYVNKITLQHLGLPAFKCGFKGRQDMTLLP